MRSVFWLSFVWITALVCIASCTDAEYERMTALGNKHKITMWSGGQKVGEWISTGSPRSVADEDGWQFKDDKTGRFITVTGDVVIEKLPD